MCNEENNTNCGCFSEILKRILVLQKQDFDNEKYSGCDKPYLGPTSNNICYNTRPIMLYNCCTGNPWTFSYILDGTTRESNIFRVESLDECCCTVRLLNYNAEEDEYTSTNQFATINLNCCGAIKCLNDIYLDICN